MTIDPKKDWRIDLAQHLKGVRFQRKLWKQYRSDWDHDHCAACQVEFSDGNGPAIQHEGYTTCSDYVHGADYDWVCLSCFDDLKDELHWVSVAAEGPNEKKRPS